MGILSEMWGVFEMEKVQEIADLLQREIWVQTDNMSCPVKGVITRIRVEVKTDDGMKLISPKDIL